VIFREGWSFRTISLFSVVVVAVAVVVVVVVVRVEESGKRREIWREKKQLFLKP
jgi:hypothetical protein